MRLKNLLDDDAGVSPVIGVILMVAITVILAAVIGTFVLNNNNLNNTAPQVNWDYNHNANGGGDSNVVTVTHEGGDDVEVTNLEVSAASATDSDLTDASGIVQGQSGTLSAGSSFDVDDSQDATTDTFGSGDTVRIVWTSPEGGSSSTIGEYEIP